MWVRSCVPHISENAARADSDVAAFLSLGIHEMMANTDGVLLYGADLDCSIETFPESGLDDAWHMSDVQD
jgi:hypothetical protein